MYCFLQFASGDYFCRVSNAKTFDTKKGNIDNCPKEYCDSSACNVKVVLPTKEQISNGYVEFSNEEIRILEQPDVSDSSETNSEGKFMSSQMAKNDISSRRAAIGYKVWSLPN